MPQIEVGDDFRNYKPGSPGAVERGFGELATGDRFDIRLRGVASADRFKNESRLSAQRWIWRIVSLALQH